MTKKIKKIKKSKEPMQILCDFVLNYMEQNRTSFEKEKAFDNGILGYDHLDDYIKDLKKYDVETLEWVLSEVLFWNDAFKNSGIIIHRDESGYELEDCVRESITILNIDGQLIQMKNTQQKLETQWSNWQTSFDFVEKKQKTITKVVEVYEVI